MYWEKPEEKLVKEAGQDPRGKTVLKTTAQSGTPNWKGFYLQGHITFSSNANKHEK